MFPSRHPFFRLAAIAVFVALIASACGSTSSVGADSATPTTFAPTEPDPTEPDPSEPEALPVEAPSMIVGAGFSFGECSGYCAGDLGIKGELATLRQQSWDGDPDRTTSGTLTVDGQDALGSMSSDILGIAFEDVYGCPDCTDGGAEFIVIAAPDGSTNKVEFEYANAPADLANASELLRGITQALTSCVSNEFIEVGDDCNKANTEPADVPVAGGPGSTFIGGGTSFGMCAGFCLSSVRFEGAAVTLVASTWIDDEKRVSAGTLTAAGEGMLVEAVAGLASGPLQETYGCPDCADGGAQFFDFVTATGTESRSSFEYNEPPEGTESASSLILSAIESLRTCTSSDLVTVADDCVAESTQSG